MADWSPPPLKEPPALVQKADPSLLAVFKSKAAPAVAATKVFRNASHNCPTCGRTQFVISGFNRDGTHSHRCLSDGTVWSH